MLEQRAIKISGQRRMQRVGLTHKKSAYHMLPNRATHWLKVTLNQIRKTI